MKRHSLAWKEYRESIPMVLLTMGFMIAYVLRPVFMGGLDKVDFGSWQNGLFSSGAAVLFFVAVVVGTMAYAVEEERNTLEPLLAKPLSVRQIFLTKVGVRLGLLFVGVGFLAVMLLVAGAWEIREPRFALSGPYRWLSAASLVVLGFGLGLYGGKTRRNQTVAVVVAITLFAAGWVLLTLSPVAGLFETAGRGEFPIRPIIRAVLIPLTAGTGAIALAWREPRHREVRIPAILGIAVGLVAYTSILLVAAGALGRSYPLAGGFRHLSTSLDLGSDDPEQVITALETRLKEAYERLDITDEDRENLLWIVCSSVVDRLANSDQTSLLMNEPRLLRYDGYEGRIMPAEPLLPEERDLAAARSPAWIATMLERMRSGDFSIIHRILALHLAGVADRPEHTELIAAYLPADQPIEVRTTAAHMLLGRKDPRGERTLLALYDEAPKQLNRVIYWTAGAHPMGPEARPLYEGWSKSTDSRYRLKMVEEYLIGLGDPADLDRIRLLRWHQIPVSRRQGATPASIDVDDVLLAWAGEGRLPELRRATHDLITHLQDLRGRIESYRLPDERIRTPEERNRERGLREDFRKGGDRLRRMFLRLTELGDPEAANILSRSLDLLELLPVRGTYYEMYGLIAQNQVLPALVRIGQPGLQLLAEIAGDTTLPAETRFQAAVLLANEGHRGTVDVAIELWRRGVNATSESVEGSPEYVQFKARHIFWTRLAQGALRDLAAAGNRAAAEALIENADLWFERGHTFAESGGFDVAGTWYWNTELVDALMKGTGQRLGWGLKSWIRWRERQIRR